jgi:hypothetical protein
MAHGYDRDKQGHRIELLTHVVTAVHPGTCTVAYILGSATAGVKCPVTGWIRHVALHAITAAIGANLTVKVHNVTQGTSITAVLGLVNFLTFDADLSVKSGDLIAVEVTVIGSGGTEGSNLTCAVYAEKTTQ